MTDPWTSTYVPPSVRLSLCSVDDGVEIALHTMLKKILDWVYDALKTTWDVVRQGIKVLNFVFPSQIALEVIKDWELNDFRMEETKFWAIQFWLFGVRMSPLPLPKIELSENFWTSIFAPLNIIVPGSDQWLYLDPSDDVIKFGYQHDPVKYYYLLSDGGKDMKRLALVTLIIWMMHKLGLFKAATGVLKAAFKWYSTRSWKRDIDDTNDWIHFLFDDMISDGDTMSEHDDKLSEMAKRVGLRLTLR